MSEHVLIEDRSDPDLARCAGCGMVVHYFRGHRSESRDETAVKRAALRHAGWKASKKKHVREATNCDLILAAVIAKVMTE